MGQKINQKTILANLSEGDSTLLTGAIFTPTTGIAQTLKSLQAKVRKERFTLTSVVVSDVSTNDFGGTKLFDLANTNLVILGCYFTAAVTIAGMTTQACTSLTAAVGTVTNASTTFANAGEKSIVGSMTGVGAGATGTIKGALSPSLLIAAGASNAIFLNIAQPVTSSTGTATFTGRIDLFYIDLGVG